jgi:hypothetical protein
MARILTFKRLLFIPNHFNQWNLQIFCVWEDISAQFSKNLCVKKIAIWGCGLWLCWLQIDKGTEAVKSFMKL